MVPFRFIHASDFRLEQAIEGVAAFPASLEERLLDVSYRAAERVFEAALIEEVHFIVLSGNLLDPLRTGPRGPLFLIAQFEKLREAGIAVYWAGGEFDSPEDWPAGFPLPDNVHIFPSSGVQEYIVSFGSIPVARLVGASRNRQDKRLQTLDFSRDTGDLFTIVVANGEVEPESLGNRRIPFWALGGRPNRSTYRGNRSAIASQSGNAAGTSSSGTASGNSGHASPAGRSGNLLSPDVGMRFENSVKQEAHRRESGARSENALPCPYIVHYPGPPIGRSPSERDVYGVTLVEIVPDEEPRLTVIETAPLRWAEETIRVAPDDTAEILAEKLRERSKAYRTVQLQKQSESPSPLLAGYDLLVRWTVEGAAGPLAHNLRRGTLASDLLSELRGLYGKEETGVPLLWSLAIELPVPESLHAAQYDLKTILGDYLRLARYFQQHPEEMIDLSPLLPKELLDDPLARRLLLCDRDENDALTQTPEQQKDQARVLREAVLLGQELLGKSS